LTAAALLALATLEVAADPPAAPAAAPSTDSSPREEITITARRSLQRQLSSFVHGITDLQNTEGVARWNVPVCPQVAGLPRQEGEFILARVSEIARIAQVPLGKEQCRPNLIVLVSADPQRELQGLHRYASSVLFGSAQPAVINEFIARPGAVKVWYKSEGMLDGTPLGDPTSTQTAKVVGGNNQFLAPFVGTLSPGGSRLQQDIEYELGQVIMIVDQRQLRGLSREQVADYLAMVGLAQIKPDAHVSGADTILGLFGSGPDAAPAGMTRWDQAYLKALYATDQESKIQRDEMARVMFRELLAEPAAPQAGEEQP